MQLSHLSLAQFRVFDKAEFEFLPGINLIVGGNGSGKSIVLDVLRILLSQAMTGLGAKQRPLRLSPGDIASDKQWCYASALMQITQGRDVFNLECLAQLGRNPAGRGSGGKNNRASIPQIIQMLGEVPEQSQPSLFDRDKSGLAPLTRSRLSVAERERIRDIALAVRNSGARPLALYYSTDRTARALMDSSRPKSIGGEESAFVDALIVHSLNLSAFADWWGDQQADAQGRDLRAKVLVRSIGNAVKRLLGFPSFLRTDPGPQPTLVLGKNGKIFDLHQLSDGERGILVFVLDLAWRLSAANPTLRDPLKAGRAVVLIDELELHLHPRRQAEFVNDLAITFPNCQFIATTQSPLIVAQVAPKYIWVLEENQPPYQPKQSLGMDSNWVLGSLMGTGIRPAQFTDQLSGINDLIERKRFRRAEKEIEDLREQIGEFPELANLKSRLDRASKASRE